MADLSADETPSDASTGGREDRPLVIVGGTAHWGRRRLAEHHIARQLTTYARVLFVDPPLSRMTAKREPALRPLLNGPRLREVEPDLHLLVPIVAPGMERPGIRQLSDWQIRRDIAWSVAHLGGPARATILTLPQRRLFDEQIEGAKVYWAKDDHVAGASLYGLGMRRVARVESQLVERSDRFLVCSETLGAAWRKRGADPVVLPNGCDVQHFRQARTAARPDDVDPGRSYAIYVGTMTDRIDPNLLRSVADRRIDVLLVGDQRRTSHWSEFKELVEHPRIQHVGRRTYEQLPAYLGAASVGLVPYRSNRYNRGSFPLKMLEYLAAGLTVVSSDLPAAHWLASQHIGIATDAHGFADLVATQMERAGSEEVVEGCHRLAQKHDWSQRAAQLAELISIADTR